MFTIIGSKSNMTLEDFFNQHSESFTWAYWKLKAQESGIEILEDISGLEDSEILDPETAKQEFEQSKIQIKAPNVDTKIADWSARYDELVKTSPKPGDHLTATNDQRVKLRVSKILGQPPRISTRAFVPDIVGSELGWFV